jgi:hypothetical protein
LHYKIFLLMLKLKDNSLTAHSVEIFKCTSNYNTKVTGHRKALVLKPSSRKIM